MINNEFLTVEYINSHFINNFILDRKKFMNFYLCDSTTVYKILNRLKIQYVKKINKEIQNFENWNNKLFIEDTFLNENNIIDKNEIEKYFNCERTSIDRQLKRLGITYKYKSQKKKTNRSKYELEIIEYIKRIFPDINILTSNYNIIPPLELDIFLPDLNLAIEFNGLYWHSFSENNNTSIRQQNFNFQKMRHITKSILCRNKKIRLIHMDETNYKTKLKTIFSQQLIDLTEIIEVNLENENGIYLEDRNYFWYQTILPDYKIVLNNRQMFDSGKIIYKRKI